MPKVNLDIPEVVNEYFKYKAKKLGTSRAFLLNMALHEQMQKEIDITPVGEKLTINQRWEHVFKDIKHE